MQMHDIVLFKQQTLMSKIKVEVISHGKTCEKIPAVRVKYILL